MNWYNSINLISFGSLLIPTVIVMIQLLTFRYRNFEYVLYFSVGFLLSQLFHSLIFWKQQAQSIKVLPDMDLPIIWSIKLSFVFFTVSFVGFIIISNNLFEKPSKFVILSVIILIISQFIGRSLIKFGFEFAFSSVLFISVIFNNTYGTIYKEDLTSDILSFYYKELWELLRLSIPVLLFFIGSVGITFAVQFLREQYFRNQAAMSQFQMFRYGIMFLYTCIGIVLFYYVPLVKKIIFLRKFILYGSS